MRARWPGGGAPLFITILEIDTSGRAWGEQSSLVKILEGNASARACEEQPFLIKILEIDASTRAWGEQPFLLLCLMYTHGCFSKVSDLISVL